MSLRFFNLIFISLLFAVRLGAAVQPAVTGPTAPAKKYTAAELKVLELMQRNHFAITKEILCEKKSNRLIGLLFEPTLQTIVRYAAFFLAIKYSNGDLNAFLNGANDLREHIFGPAAHPNFAIIKRHMGNVINNSGLKYAVPAFFLTGLASNILTDLLSAPRFVSLNELDKFEACLSYVLSKCDKGYELKDEGRDLSPEFFNEILSTLDKDFVLIYDKVISENSLFDKGFISLLFNSLRVAICVYFVEQGYFKISFLLSFCIIFALYKYVLPSKNNFKKVKKLGEIYKSIIDAKAKYLKTLKKETDVVPTSDVPVDKPTDPKIGVITTHTINTEPVAPPQAVSKNSEELEADFLKKHRHLLRMPAH